MADDYEDPLKGLFLPEEDKQFNTMPTYNEAMGALTTESGKGKASTIRSLVGAGYLGHNLVQGAGKGMEHYLKGGSNPIADAYKFFIRQPMVDAGEWVEDDNRRRAGHIQTDDAGNEYAVEPDNAQALSAAMGAASLGASAPLVAGSKFLAKTGGKKAAAARVADRSNHGIVSDKALGSETGAFVDGKPPSEWGPNDFERFGDYHGVENLGGNSKMIDVERADGGSYQIPETFLDSNKMPSYFDQLALKAQAVNPKHIDSGIQKTIHDRMISAVNPAEKGGMSFERAFNNSLFGISSPGQGLTNNGLTQGRLMAKSPGDIEKIANMTPWEFAERQKIGGISDPNRRRLDASNSIAREMGWQMAEEGGTGVKGKIDWSRASDLGKLFRDNPKAAEEFFSFEKNFGDAHTPENWQNHIEKLTSQVPGISMKTGSLGAVFENPRAAQISAMDLHMGTQPETIKAIRDSNPGWEKTVLERWRTKKGLPLKTKKGPQTIEELIVTPGAKTFYGDQVLQELGKAKNPKIRRAKDGEFNESLPDWMKQTKWMDEPEKGLLSGDAYTNAMMEYAKTAAKNDRGIFSEQWGIWDPIRKIMSPHEFMNPDLEKIGRMNFDQFKLARDAHARAGLFGKGEQGQGLVKPQELAVFAKQGDKASTAAGAFARADDSRYGGDAYHWSSSADEISPDNKFNPFSHFGTTRAAYDRFKDMAAFGPGGKDKPGGTLPVELDIKNPLRIQDTGNHNPVSVAADIEDALVKAGKLPEGSDLPGRIYEQHIDELSDEDIWALAEEAGIDYYVEEFDIPEHQAADFLAEKLKEDFRDKVQESLEDPDSLTANRRDAIIDLAPRYLSRNADHASTYSDLDTLLGRNGYDGLVYENSIEGGGADSYIATRPGTVRSKTTGETLYDQSGRVGAFGLLPRREDDK